jgi:hypothetical protein
MSDAFERDAPKRGGTRLQIGVNICDRNGRETVDSPALAVPRQEASCLADEAIDRGGGKSALLDEPLPQRSPELTRLPLK